MNQTEHKSATRRPAGDAWTVYVVQAGDSTLYTGITTDLERRIEQHRCGQGAKYLRGRTPLAVVLIETGYDRSAALKREAQIKKLDRTGKLALIAAQDPGPVGGER